MGYWNVAHLQRTQVILPPRARRNLRSVHTVHLPGPHPPIALPSQRPQSPRVHTREDDDAARAKLLREGADVRGHRAAGPSLGASFSAHAEHAVKLVRTGVEKVQIRGDEAEGEAERKEKRGLASL